MMISVVIPAYNEEKYIGQCLASLSAQTYTGSVEIIVVDNNCTDRTAELARAWGATVVSETMKGIGAARQRGALAAQGDIIASTDADTVVPPTWLQRIARRFEVDAELGGLYGPLRHIDGSDIAKAYMIAVMPLLMHVTDRINMPCFSGNNFAVRRAKLLAVGGYNTRLLTGEDVDLSIRMSKITRLEYDPSFIAYTSSRRAQEGVPRILGRTVASGLRFILRGESPLAPPDIR